MIFTKERGYPIDTKSIWKKPPRVLLDDLGVDGAEHDGTLTTTPKSTRLLEKEKKAQEEKEKKEKKLADKKKADKLQVWKKFHHIDVQT